MSPPTSLKEIEWQPGGRDPRYFDIGVAPLTDNGVASIGAVVTFVDVTRVQDLQAQLTRSRQDLETAYEELQSTNEELETMNEELQSTNEEMHTINEELRERSEELNQTNSFLESILTGVRSGVAVVDREFRVVAWNHRSEDLWGLRADEVRGQNSLNLDIGLPTQEIRPGLRACLSGELEFWETTLGATNRRGRSISCKVTCTPLTTAARDLGGVIVLVDEEADHSAASS